MKGTNNYILELSKKINHNHLTYYKNKNIADKNFNNFRDALSFLKKIRDDNIMLKKQYKIKIDFKIN